VTAVAHFREEGYLPEALVNYLALLGWTSEDGQEIFTLGDLAPRFSLGRVSRSSAVFDYEKLKWMNRAHMKDLHGKRALELAGPFLQKSGINLEGRPEAWRTAALESVWEDADTLSQLPDRLRIFLDEGWIMEAEAQRLLAKEQSRKVVQGLAEELKTVQEVTPENYESILSRLSKRVGLSGRNLYMPLRAALTGKTRGPELEKVFILLGKEKALLRAESALQPTE
jgi:nondiscriminating glutamyl-tRNA synthetase